MIAGAVALVATGLGAVGVAIKGVASVAALTKVGAIASTVAAVASVGAQLTAPKPIARGSPAQITIDIEPPRPYVVGRVMVGGVLRHDVAYGPTLKKVPNPYRWQVRVMSGVGPIQGFVQDYFDFAPIATSFYNSDFLRISKQLGARPEANALAPLITRASNPPGWPSSARLSGCAAVGLNLLFDKDGKRYANGIPIYTAVLDGEKVYDPRLDSTFPGGSGPCRAGDESTYVFSHSPALHTGTYALGRFQNGLRIFGLGQAFDTIDWAAIVDWANDCQANGWTVNMVLQEGGTGANLREQRVRNLDDLCTAGGGRWYQAGGLLSFDWFRPRLALDTLTDDDILQAGGGTDAVQTIRARMNGVRPQYVSPNHNWQQITAKEIVGSTYRTEDGSPLTQVWPLNGVTNPEQAGQLATYAMADSRELGPMDVQAKAKWRFYRPGDCIDIDSSLIAYQGQAVINQRSLNPDSLAVSLSLKSETPGKHAFALGKVADPPPTPVLAQTAEERDLLADAIFIPRPEDLEYPDGTPIADLQPAEPDSDVTATAQRSIVPQFPIIEIKQGEAGNVGDRVILHSARRGTDTLGGGTWSLPAQVLGAGTATINASTGAVTLSGVMQSGSYTIRYTHTDGIATDLDVNVTYIAAPTAPGSATASGSLTNPSSSVLSQISPALEITLPAGVTTATLSATNVDLELIPELPTGITDVEFQWQHETSPGTWADEGAAATSSPSPSVFDNGVFLESVPGLISISRTITGLAAGSTQRFRLMGRISSGNVRLVIVSGTAVASA